MPKYINKSRFMLTKPIFMKFFNWSQSDDYVLLEKPEVPIFQFRLGFTWVLVVNNMDLYRDLIVKNSKKTNDRPLGESFHKILSRQNNVFTIGTTPHGEDYDKIKTFFQKQFLTNHNLDEHFSKIIIHECKNFMDDVDDKIVDPLPLFQKYVSRISCWLCFGIDLNDALDNEYSENDTVTGGNLQHGIVSEIAYIEREIVKLRNPMTNALDHLPKFLKHLLYKDKIAKIDNIKDRRNRYIHRLYNMSKENYQKRMAKDYQPTERNSNGIDSLNINNENLAFEHCLITKFLNENSELLKEHILAICLTMMSAGLDNISSLMNNVIHRLSQGTSEMEHLQKNSYEEIFFNQKKLTNKMTNSMDELISDLYKIPSADVQSKMDQFGRFSFIKSLMYENIRFVSVAPLGLPRLATDNINLGMGVTIPKGTKIITNLYLMNHSLNEFHDPYKFNPYRFFEEERCPCDQCVLEKDFEHPEDTSVLTLSEPNYGKLRIFGRLFHERELHIQEKGKLCLINGFGKGSRVCLGKRLAEYEMYYMLYHLLAYYRLKSTKATFVPMKNRLEKVWLLSSQTPDTSRVNIQETDPRINNTCLDGISIEQKWDCLVSFENRRNINVGEKHNSVDRSYGIDNRRSISLQSDPVEDGGSALSRPIPGLPYSNRRIVSIT